MASSAAGTIEFEAALGSPGGDSTADVVGIKTGIGRIVRLNSDDLPILPKAEYYEVWFVGPGDTPAAQPHLSRHLSPGRRGPLRGGAHRSR